MQGKLPVTIFTGFLGAGKTTLLSNLILAEPNINFAIIINEFGIVSVDDILVSSALQPSHRQSQLYKLGGGLIAYQGDIFMQTMLEIASNKSLYDHVLIETSGLAVPTAVIEALHHEELIEHFNLDATLALLDTPLFLRNSDSTSEAIAEVFTSQILASDIVVLNKIDKLTSQELETAENNVRNLAPQVRFIEPAWHGKLDSRLCLGLHLNEFRALEHIPGVTSKISHNHELSQTNADGHSHGALGAHEHGISTHEHLHQEDPAWLSFCLISEEAQERKLLEKALEIIATELPLLRVKGFVKCQGMAEPLLIQGVRERIVSSTGAGEIEHKHEPELVLAHSHHNHDHKREHEHKHEHEHRQEQRHEHNHNRDHNNAEDHQHDHSQSVSQLVLIGYELEREAAVRLLIEHTNKTWY